MQSQAGMVSPEALADPRRNWPVEWLKRLVPQLLADDFWPPPPPNRCR